MRLLRAQQVPQALLDNPTFRGIIQVVTPRSFGLPSDLTIRPDVRAQLALLSREMVMAWQAVQEEGIWDGWVRAVEKARKLGF